MHKGISHLPRKEQNASKVAGSTCGVLSPFHGCGKGFCIGAASHSTEVKRFAKREDIRAKETNCC